MNKQEFINRLNKGLAGLPQKEREERITFYSEMIDDRIEEGFSEEAAVLEIGKVDDVASQIIAEISTSRNFGEVVKVKEKRRAWEIVLLAVGFPLWGALLIAAFAIIFAVYVVLCALAISMCAVFVALLVCAPVGVVAGCIALFANVPLGFFLIGVGIVCAGVSIFLFFACKSAIKGVFVLLKKWTVRVITSFRKKEAI